MEDIYLENLYKDYQKDPASVPQQWRYYFMGVESLPQESFAQVDAETENTAIPGGQESAGEASSAQNSVTRLIQAYRYHGHRHADTNPLENAKEIGEELSLKHFGIKENQLEDIFATSGVLPQSHAKLSEILSALKRTWCGALALQIGDISCSKKRAWLRNKLETTQSHPKIPPKQQQNIYYNLMRAEAFEKFLHSKFTGLKRFSAEGGDTLIPMLSCLVEAAGEGHMEHVVIGMAHRGRLNVLANIMEKPMEEIFAAFADNVEIDSDIESTGDVKYHQGKSTNITTPNGQLMHLSLLSNPSHLEAINPVLTGNVYAKQQRYKNGEGDKKVLPLLIHGDSAFAGQGVVAETLNLSRIQGFSVGGTVHVVVNNQIGFTAEPHEVFSGEYCTDIAKLLQCPVFHVNGDNPEACVYAMQLAFEYRQKFGEDVVIELVCYRRHGHNEGDDPSFTQPLMYKKIKAHKTPATLYKNKLFADKNMTETEAKALDSAYQNTMRQALQESEGGLVVKPDVFKKGSPWGNFVAIKGVEENTKISKKQMQNIAEVILDYPTNFTPNKKVNKVIEQRASMLQGEEPINWGAAETLAYGTLLEEGHSVRFTGQDVQRGTFSHRHIVMVDAETGERFTPMSRLLKNDCQFECINSSLSEEAVLGFEFGYSIAAPNALNIWEAQFGDFANTAQAVFDQFIATCESKWHLMCGLVVQLPHGLEGQGPEHSSARIERFLSLSANNNWAVCVPSTPAQMFHLLRRQMKRNYRKPLIAITPKSLLRHPLAVSQMEDFTKQNFMPVIGDSTANPKDVKRVVLCAGKVYYDLLAAKAKRKDIAIIRLEQLFPLPIAEIKAELKKYKTEDVVWVQEEPRNQGAWGFLLDNMWAKLGLPAKYIGREAIAAPAVGSHKVYLANQQKIIDEVFGNK